MCLAIPGKIISKKENSATVDFDGIKKQVNISLVKAKVGEYVIVHAGFAIQKLSQEDAFEVFKIHESVHTHESKKN
jgi:hydrogenase expression/formation protein HypC